MRVLMSTYGSRGDVEPLVALALRLRELGAEVRMCAPPDFAQRMADVGVPFVPVGPSASALTASAPPVSSFSQRAADLIANQFEAVAAAADGCDVLVATGMVPAAAGALSVAEKLGLRAVSVTFQQLTLPSPHRRPLAYPGRPFPQGVTDNRVLWDLDAQSNNELFGEALNINRTANGLPPVADVRGYVLGDRPWLATDPVLDPWEETPDFEVVQTGAWIEPDTRSLPSDVEAFINAGTPPVFVAFSTMHMHASADTVQLAIEAIRAQGRRALVSHSSTGIDDQDDCFFVGEVNHQALFRRVAAVVHHGGAGTTTTATRAGAPQVVIPQLADQPYWASRVADLGIGVALEDPTSESVSAAVKTALTAETRARATEVAGAIRTDGAEVAAKMLLGATAG
ncbi:glycosyltransferase [Kibdelosporangium aridum]|uniref:UDP:flavonoid glycosyltransferase YjiC, YdhE family n=1 Tax=Kibdelosporangium aridum TaxID=2030 RepID=A0A1W2EPW7_KIBAR|nr:glycosyltransferase [Kibdelosporangium aridum]SMD11754.1 UDP:flavonoid glycosyltransferase YjiC, YdhE family [Kibdelosporangium aridum]